MIKSALLAAILTLFSGQVLANSLVQYIEINNDIVTLHMTNRDNNVAACVDANHTTKWAFSLKDVSGRNLYRIALMAHSSQKSVSIASSGDCSALSGIERPVSIAVSLM